VAHPTAALYVTSSLLLSSRWPLTLCSSKPTKCVYHKLGQNTNDNNNNNNNRAPVQIILLNFTKLLSRGYEHFFRTFFQTVPYHIFLPFGQETNFKIFVNDREIYIFIACG
jgi:hypothetical protein